MVLLTSLFFLPRAAKAPLKYPATFFLLPFFSLALRGTRLLPAFGSCSAASPVVVRQPDTVAQDSADRADPDEHDGQPHGPRGVPADHPV